MLALVSCSQPVPPSNVPIPTPPIVVDVSPPPPATPGSGPPLSPNPDLTPGVADPAVTQANIKSTICVAGYSSGVRNVSQMTKNAVFREYGVDPKSDHFEVDHLVSLELGGENDIRNLWPESYDSQPVNAHTKDALEDHLHALVCAGKVALDTAQRAIASNWRAAYGMYMPMSTT